MKFRVVDLDCDVPTDLGTFTLDMIMAINRFLYLEVIDANMVIGESRGFADGSLLYTRIS